MEEENLKDEDPILNEALLLIKPHASRLFSVRQLVAQELAIYRISIANFFTHTGADVSRFIDKHYKDLSRGAYGDVIQPTEDVLLSFKNVFNVAWEESVVINCVEAFDILRVTPTEMEKLWRAGPYLKLAPGRYVARVDKYFVINGFYEAMKQDWVKEDALVCAYIVRWKEENLSWADFRDKVIGATEPSKAHPESIRGKMWKNSEEMGLGKELKSPFNGVHASAGPFEAARECQLWSGDKHVPLLREAAKKAAPDSDWERAMRNPKLQDGRFLFDATEGVGAQQALEIFKSLQ